MMTERAKQSKAKEEIDRERGRTGFFRQAKMHKVLNVLLLLLLLVGLHFGLNGNRLHYTITHTTTFKTHAYKCKQCKFITYLSLVLDLCLLTLY